MSTSASPGDSIGIKIGNDNQIVAAGKTISLAVNQYANVSSQLIAQETLDEAMAKLAELPLGEIPRLSVPPTNSRIPLSANPLFVGREDELRKIASLLKGGETVAVGQTVAATGMGGIGKTQLASAFIHRYGRFFQGGVFWLSMADPEAIRAEVADCGLRMSGLHPDYASLDLATQVSLVLGAWQSALPRLLVFDNCEEPILLKQWRPSSGSCRVLVTSRRSQWDDGLAVQALHLNTLTRAQSIELLSKFRPDLDESDEALDAIAVELGDLPLALHLAGSYLKRYRRSVEPTAYVEQLRSSNLLQHRSLVDGGISPTDHEQHVARTFALSYDLLDDNERLRTLARQLLARAVCFAPGEPISFDLLFSSAATDKDNLDSILQFEDALHLLTELGLIEPQEGDDILVHRLIAHFVQGIDPEVATDARKDVESAALSKANGLNNAGIPGPLLTWQSHLRYIAETAVRASQNEERTADLCNALGFHLKMAGELEAVRPYYQQALEIRLEVLGDMHPDTALSLSNMGELLDSMGELEAALPYYQQALEIRLETLGERHPDTALSLNNIGYLLQAMGKLEAARPYIQQALDISLEVLGEKHPDTASSLNNMGELLDDMGELEAARAYYRQALEIRLEVLGDKHPLTAISLNNMGYLLQAMGELEAARAYYRQALEIRLEVLGDKHHHTASSLNNMGGLLKAIGELDAALPYYQQALDISLEVLGGKHPDTASSLNNMGGLLHDMGELDAARAYYQQTLEIRLEILGDMHPFTAISLNNMGYLLQDLGELEAARAYHQQALEVRLEVLGDMHPHTALSFNNMGFLLQAMGDLEAARPYFQQALDISLKVLGDKHPFTASILNNTGYLLQAMGQLEGALPYHQQALDIRLGVLGDMHPDTALSFNNMGELLQAMGELDGVLPYYQQALEIRLDVLGDMHPDTALSLNSMGFLLRAQGLLEAACPYFQQALDILEEKLGASHPKTNVVRGNLESLNLD